MQILDGMSPHVWQGPTAAQDWYRDTLNKVEHAGASGLHIGVGEPRHVDVSGDYAYVVVPVTLAFKLPDRQVNQPAQSSRLRFVKSAQIGVLPRGRGQKGLNSLWHRGTRSALRQRQIEWPRQRGVKL